MSLPAGPLDDVIASTDYSLPASRRAAMDFPEVTYLVCHYVMVWPGRGGMGGSSSVEIEVVACYHAPTADEHHALEPEALRQISPRLQNDL
jgi:hypothetical protein